MCVSAILAIARRIPSEPGRFEFSLDRRNFSARRYFKIYLNLRLTNEVSESEYNTNIL